jgi:hypothetical protein
LGINETLTTCTAGKLRLGYPESITPEEIPNKCCDFFRYRFLFAFIYSLGGDAKKILSIVISS